LGKRPRLHQLGVDRHQHVHDLLQPALHLQLADNNGYALLCIHQILRFRQIR
jgi:hypothetical protein